MKRVLLLLSLLPLTALAQAPAPATPAPAPARPAPASPAAAKPATAGAPALTAAQQAQVQKQDAEMGAAAVKAAQLVDANRAGELWDGASAVARRAVPKAAFVSQLTTERTRLGALAGCTSTSVSRPVSPTAHSRCASWSRSDSTRTRCGAWPATACVRRHPEEMNDGN
jgi:hypothetical protein